MADFKWYLNRQGIQGRKGDKGEQGFSPIISEGVNDADEYTLLVTNENNTFETPNLRGNFVINDDGVNSTVLYDRENNQLRTGEPVQATTEQLGAMVIASSEDFETINGSGKVVTVDNLVDNFTKIVGSSDGTVTITQDEETSKIDLKARGVEIDDAVEVENKTWSSSKIMSTIDNMSTVFNQFIGNLMTSISGELNATNEKVTTNTNNITELQQEVTNTQGDIAALDADVSTLNSVVESHTGSITAINNNIGELNTNKVSKTELTEELAKKQNSLVSGDNITIVNNEDGTATISSTGGSGEAPANMVTTDTDQIITGLKTFTQDTGSYRNTIKIGRTTDSGRNGLHFNAVTSAQQWSIDSIGYTASSLYFAGFGNGVYFSNAIYDRNGNEILGGGGDASIDDNNIATTTTYSSEKIVNYVTTSIDSAMTTLDNAKQDKLTAGDGISISGGVISVTGGGSGGGAMIDDEDTTSLDKTWSCNKLNTELGNVSSALTEIEGGLTATLENYAKLDVANIFTIKNTFNAGLTSNSVATDYIYNSTGYKVSTNSELTDGSILKARNPFIGFTPVTKTFELSDGSTYKANIGDVLIQGSKITLDCGDLSALVTEVENGIFDGNGDRILSQGNVTSTDNSITVTKSDKGLDLAVAGASGTFTTADGKTVTVTNGLITSIE